MADVIVIRPGTALWNELAADRPASGEWTSIALSDDVVQQLGLAAGTAGVGAAASTYTAQTAQGRADALSRAGDDGALLLFDEADALFTKRSSVQDSHDRYANLDTAYRLTQAELGSSLTDTVRNDRPRLHLPRDGQ